MGPLNGSSRDMFFCSTLKHRFEELALPSDPDIREHKKFFLKSQIVEFLNPEVVLDLMLCRCQKCTELKQISNVNHRQQASTHKIITRACKQERVQETYSLTLALLLYIGYPALIFDFVSQKCHDERLKELLEQPFPMVNLVKLWPSLHRQNPQQSSSIARQLRSKGPNIFIPVLRDDEFSCYDQYTILPFVNERQIGLENDEGDIVPEGAYGKIFAFEIPDEYRAFKATPNVRRFVRKELHDSNHSFILECHNLDYIRSIRDDHIVRVVKTYKHGNVGNIIFPQAVTNLGHYLRDASFGALERSSPRLCCNPLWDQMLGLARALHKILAYEAEDERRNQIHYGYHFDLKPANVLVEKDGTLIISDFGQAHFRRAGNTSSNVSGFGGTESYAPPEIDNIDLRQNRRYDIWSLGCIFIEICTFMTLGYNGVHELDGLRINTSADRSSTDDRFFVRESGSCKLKPSIIHWMTRIVDGSQTTTDKTMMSDMLDLVRSMLDVDVQTRCDSKRLCYTLSEVLSAGRKNTPTSPELEPPRIDNVPEGVPVGNGVIPYTKSVKYYLRYWSTGSFSFSCSKYALYLHTLESQRSLRTRIGDIRCLKVVPRYAMSDTASHRFSDASLFLQTSNDSDARTMTGEKFWSDNTRDVLYMQEALTEQRVAYYHEVAGFALSPAPTGKVPKIFQLRSRVTKLATKDPATLQIWAPSRSISCLTPDEVPAKPQVPPSSGGPSPRRIVVITKSIIHVVRIDGHVKLAPLQRQSEGPFVQTLVPAKQSSGVDFSCLSISKAPGELLPGIPLCNKILILDEDKMGRRLDKLEIAFNSSQELNSFRDEYRVQKYRWQVEHDRLVQHQNDIGPKYGYARNST